MNTLNMLLLTCLLLLVTPSLCQYIDDLVPGCKRSTPESVCGSNEDYVTVSGFLPTNYEEMCARVNGSDAMYSIDDTSIYGISIVTPYTNEGCNIYTNFLLKSTGSYQYVCPKNVALELLPARMEMIGRLRQNYTHIYCNGTFVPGEYNNKSSTAAALIMPQKSNIESVCNNYVDLSASGTGWNEWFDNSDYVQQVLSQGLSTVVNGFKSKQWQAACLSRNNSMVMDANDVNEGNLVKKQFNIIKQGGVPSEQKSTTRAQYREFKDKPSKARSAALGMVQQLTLYSDSICTYNEVGKCLTQVRYYCQPNATSIQNSGSSIYWDIPNGCFFQMRMRNAGPGNSSANPLFSTGKNELSSKSSFLENSQHTVDWEDDNSVFVTDYGDYTQVSLLPRGAQYKLCSNNSLATAIPFYNKLYGVSNLQVIAKNDNLCILGNTTSIFDSNCATDLDAGLTSVWNRSSAFRDTCINEKHSNVCNSDSILIVLGAHFNELRYDCDEDETNCDYTNAVKPSNVTCSTWYVSGGDVGTYEVTNRTDIKDYYSINETSDSNIFLAYAASTLYLGYGDGILCGQQRDMMTAAAKCYSNCYNNLTNGQRRDPCDIEISAFGKTFDGEECSFIFEKYGSVRNQLGVPAQHTVDGLLGTLGSGIFGVSNRNVRDLGDIQSVNTSITTGTIANDALANKYQDGYCYIPISGISGYRASDEGYEVNIPISQGITQMQTKTNVAQLADKLSSSIRSLQNYAQQQTPPVSIATILLTITSCLGALTGVKILELYILVHGLFLSVNNTQARKVANWLIVVIITVTLTAFAVAPAIAMFIQDRMARHTHYSTTFGNYVQNDLYSSDLSTLSIVSTSVSYVQYTPYGTAVDVVFYFIIAICFVWWLYATVRILRISSTQVPHGSSGPLYNVQMIKTSINPQGPLRYP